MAGEELFFIQAVYLRELKWKFWQKLATFVTKVASVCRALSSQPRILTTMVREESSEQPELEMHKPGLLEIPACVDGEN